MRSIRWSLLAVVASFSTFALYCEEPKPAVPPDKNDKPVPPGEGSRESPAALEPVTVTAPIAVTPARLPEPVTNTGVSVTVINGKEDREVEQHIQLTDSVRYTPGVTVGRSGQAGDF